MDCVECRRNSLEKSCIECEEIIDGSYLAKEPQKKFRVKLKKIDNIDNKESFKGSVELISPIGLALKSKVPKGKYRVKLLDNLELVVSLVKGRGKPPYQGFDIISVFRDEEKNKRLNKEDFEMLSQPSEDIIDRITEDLPATTKNIVRERLKEEVEKSKLLDALDVGEILKYERGRIKRLSTGSNISLSDDYLKEFMEESFRERNHKKDTVIDEKAEKVYNLHALPLDHKSGGMITIDVTEVIEKERKNQNRELEIYRDVIEAVTGGKLKLIGKKELERELSGSNTIIKEIAKESKDIAKVRKTVRKILKRFNFETQEMSRVLLCVSEAVTNALKHAGGGEVSIKLIENILKVVVVDQGSGIDFKNLPKATLMKNYSDSATFSLGSGFTLMLRFMDRLLLKTDKQGTTLILEKEIS